jgi:ribosomal protein L37AE/L43A
LFEQKQKLQDQLLEELSSAQGNILQNEKLISTLNHIKESTVSIEASLRESFRVRQELTKDFDKFKEICENSASLFMGITRIYSMNIATFLKIFVDVIRDDKNASFKDAFQQEPDPSGQQEPPCGDADDSTDSVEEAIQRVEEQILQGRRIRKKFKCTICGRKIADSRGYQKHLICDICKGRFSNESHLKVHLVTHHQLQPVTTDQSDQPDQGDIESNRKNPTTTPTATPTIDFQSELISPKLPILKKKRVLC